MISDVLRLGTRGSPLALAQAKEVELGLGALHPGEIETVVIKTTGDKVQNRTLADIGGKGLFTKEIDEALAAGAIDLAVHSMKDLPTQLPDGFVLAAVLKREDCRDAFLSLKAASLAELPAGAVVGTASLRRAAQVLLHRPDLVVQPLRGNVETRLRRLREGTVDATLLALAGLKRLGMEAHARSILETQEMLPAVAQGAIALVCRADDAAARRLAAPLDHIPSRQAVTAERAFLAVLDGSCRTPIAGLAEIETGLMRFRGLVARPDGSEAFFVDKQGVASSAEAVGRAAAEELLSHLPAKEDGPV